MGGNKGKDNVPILNSAAAAAVRPRESNSDWRFGGLNSDILEEDLRIKLAN